MHRSTRPAAVLVPVALACAACGKKDDAHVAPAASALAASTADAAATVWRYTIDPTSVARTDMQGVKEHIVGDASAAAGTLDVVPSDLAQSRGTVRIDLTTFATHTFHDDKDATQTKHARTWLEVQVGDATNEAMRWAELAIRSIDAASATDLAKVTPTRDGGDDVRTVTMTVHGDLLIHGHRTHEDVPVEVAFRYPAGAAADSKPARIAVATKEPMRVVLKEFDVRPRDPAGVALAWTTNLVAKVADVANVTVDLNASPTP